MQNKFNVTKTSTVEAEGLTPGTVFQYPQGYGEENVYMMTDRKDEDRKIIINLKNGYTYRLTNNPQVIVIRKPFTFTPDF